MSSLYSEHYENVKKYVKESTKSEEIDEHQEKEIAIQVRLNLEKDCMNLPNFPDIDLVTNISGQKYERGVCVSNMAFIPRIYEEEISKNLFLQYQNRISFTNKNSRMIRKLLESVDKNFCLVFFLDNENTNQAVGTIDLKFVDKVIPVFKITGHMEWEAYIGKKPLFAYKNGQVCDVVEKYNKMDFKNEFEATFGKSHDTEFDNIERLVNYISKTNHGTSLVIFEQSVFEQEFGRLVNKNAGHGIELKEPFDFSTFNPDTEPDSENTFNLKNFLDQNTKIDGGFLIGLDCKIKAIGCIFDGKVYEKFIGNSGRGSRYNSIKLYVDENNSSEKKQNCLGVVFSDDGTVDFIGKKSLKL